MASRWAVVILGMSTPDVSDDTSSMADSSWVAPVVLMDTPWEKLFEIRKTIVIITKIPFFMVWKV